MPTTPSRHARPLGGALLLVTLVALVTLAACSSSSASSSGAPTATISASATATTGQPTTTATLPPGTLTGAALAWIQQPAQGKPEVWASLHGAPARRIAQASGDDCSTSELGPPVLSPDLQHIAVVGGAGCGDGQEHGAVFIVTMASGAFTPVPNADRLTHMRSVVWLDNATLLIGGATYTLGAAGVTTLPGAGGDDVVVRGSLLFYTSTSADPNHSLIRVSLHRYSLTAHHDLNTIDLGAFELPTGRSPGDFHYEGWDASPDGAHVVYQVTAPGPAGDSQLEGIASSHIYYVNADDSNPTLILQYMHTDNMVRMRLSPDGTQVAVSEATPAPDLITGCVASPGTKTDPCFHSYTLPDGAFSSGYPAWSADGRSFVVGGNGPSSGGLYRVTVGGGAVLAQPNASNPWGTA